jgi:hypothetical protein
MRDEDFIFILDDIAIAIENSAEPLPRDLLCFLISLPQIIENVSETKL